MPECFRKSQLGPGLISCLLRSLSLRHKVPEVSLGKLPRKAEKPARGGAVTQGQSQKSSRPGPSPDYLGCGLKSGSIHAHGILILGLNSVSLASKNLPPSNPAQQRARFRLLYGDSGQQPGRYPCYKFLSSCYYVPGMPEAHISDCGCVLGGGERAPSPQHECKNSAAL